jgi:uncharacterized membrane protein (UPF0127 family)
MPNTSRCRILNRTRGSVIADQVVIADTFLAGARGLIGREHLPDAFALVIKPCKGIHTLFMSVALDVVHVDSTGHIVRILHGIKPWRVGPIVWKGTWVIELPAGTARATETQVGDVVELIDGEISGRASIGYGMVGV